jgi:hypothetical protein
MKATIHYLQAMLSTLETNEPINRNAGNTEQADLESRDAAELRQAIAILRGVLEPTELRQVLGMVTALQAGPIWPTPQAG